MRACKQTISVLGSTILQICEPFPAMSSSCSSKEMWWEVEARPKDDTFRYYANVLLAISLALIDLTLLGWYISKRAGHFF